MRRLRKLTAAMAAMATTMKSIMIKNIFLAQLTDLLDLLALGTPVHGGLTANPGGEAVLC